MIDDEQLISELLESDLIDRSRAKRGIAQADKEDTSVYEVVIRHDLVDERDVVDTASDLLNVPCVHLDDVDIDAEVADMLSAKLARDNEVVPIELVDDDGEETLKLGMTDPIDVLAMDEIADHTGVDIQPVLVGPVDLERTIEAVYEEDEDDDSAIELGAPLDEGDNGAIELGDPLDEDEDVFELDDEDDDVFELDGEDGDVFELDDEDDDGAIELGEPLDEGGKQQESGGDAGDSSDTETDDPDDSWAAMFDEASEPEDESAPSDDGSSGGRPPSLDNLEAPEQAPDSGPISREMRDRPPTGVMEVVEDEDDASQISQHGPAFSRHPAMNGDDEDATEGTQIGAPAGLDDWELDEALEKSGAGRLDQSDSDSGNGQSDNNATQVGGPVDPDQWDLDDGYYEGEDDEQAPEDGEPQDDSSGARLEIEDPALEADADPDDDAEDDPDDSVPDQTQIGVPSGELPEDLELEQRDREDEDDAPDSEDLDPEEIAESADEKALDETSDGEEHDETSDDEDDEDDDSDGIVPSSLRQALDRAKNKKKETDDEQQKESEEQESEESGDTSDDVDSPESEDDTASESDDSGDESDDPSTLGRIDVKTKRVSKSDFQGVVEKRSDRQRQETREQSSIDPDELDDESDPTPTRTPRETPKKTTAVDPEEAAGLGDDNTSAYEDPSTREMKASDLSSLASSSGKDDEPAVELPDDIDSERLLRGLVELLVDRDILDESDIEQLLEQLD